MTVTYQSLRDAGATEWITFGPNSGGVEGLLLHEGLVYWFYADWKPSVDPKPLSVAEFVRRYFQSAARGTADLVAHLIAEDPSLRPSKDPK